MALHIVLFEPEIPQNSGNISRTCAALGATLHLVHPLGFSLDEKRIRRAGLDYWSLLTIKEYNSTSEFLEINGDKNLWFYTTKAHHTYSDVDYEDDSYLIFGKETAGISESILVQYPERCVRLPMVDQARSINLANSVAVAAYEWERQHNFVNLQAKGQLHNLSWPKAK
ncbi:MAG: tRNA (cytidine(34)-2'-O)-methyltransferase [Sphaerochaetaceae bacterium]